MFSRLCRVSALIVASVCLAGSLQATEIIQTIAGGGSLEGYGPLKANLLLGNSAGVAISAIGEVYISDSAHNQVLKVNPTTGLITVVAGNGTAAYFGDGLPAPSAGLNNPGGLAFDATGNLFIADRSNFTVRRVDALSGVITTVAGYGLFTGQVVGTNPPASMGDGLVALAATFGTMGDITVDAAGAILVADTGNHCVRKFTVGGTIATIAGLPQDSGFSGDTGPASQAELNNPTGVAVDGSGNVYIADSNNRRVRRVDGAGTIDTIAGSGGNASGFDGDGGAATVAQLGSLGGLAFDKNGALLISCVGANRIRKVDLAASPPLIFTIAGGGTTTIGDLGPATGATFSAPRDVAVDALGNIYIYDSGFSRIRRIDFITGFIDTVVGTGLRGFIGDRGPSQNGVLVAPKGAAFDAAGNLYVADTGDNAIRKVGTDGIITTFAGNGTASAGSSPGDGGPARLATLSVPTDVCIVGNTLYIADTGHDAIRAVDLTTGLISTYVAINNPNAIIADGAGVLYVSHDNVVEQVLTDRTVVPYAGANPINTMANPNGDGLPADNARLQNPSGLALGPGGELYIADTGNDLIRMIGAPPGLLTSTIVGGGAPVFPSIGDGGPGLQATLNNPTGITLDTAGNLIIADTDNHRIRAYNLASTNITTIAGNGTAGFTGDGGIPSAALVNFPAKVFLNGAVLVIVDSGNNRVRKIVSATDIDPKLLSFAAKLTFSIDKKTGQLALEKDAVALKAALPLPAGISAANLIITVDIVDLHQQVQLDATGKMPKAVKAAKAPKETPIFDFTLPNNGPAPVSKFSLSLKGTSVAGAKPTSFSFASKGTFREELGRAGFTDVTTAKEGIELPVRINITLGSTVFTGLTTVQWKATQGKGGAAKSIKTK